MASRSIYDAPFPKGDGGSSTVQNYDQCLRTIKDTGLRCTWPNFVARDGARGQEYNSPQGGGNSPEHATVLPFTRMLAGLMDFTPDIFNISPPGECSNKVETTLAKQLALFVVLYSPVRMADDLPEKYEANP